MARSGRICWRRGVAILALVAASGRSEVPTRGDTVLLKDGTTYRGTVDKDNTLVFVSDSLKRTIFYNSKITKEIFDNGFQNLARFQLIQPLEVHAGAMPPAAVDIAATPWDAKGRRKFEYRYKGNAKVGMQQAINDISPHLVRYRGIDGFWVGQVATSEVPRGVIMGLLAKVEQGNEDERLKVARFLIQAQWYDEARTALADLERDFPRLKETLVDVRRSVAESRARDALLAAGAAARAQQPAEARNRLLSVDAADLPREILDEAREALRRDDEQAALDRAMADQLRDLAEKLGEVDRPAWKARVAEVLLALAEVPEVARGRLGSVLKVDSPTATGPAEARFALAMSSWVVGPEAAVDSLSRASSYWQARQWVQNYLVGRVEPGRRDPKAKAEPPRAPDNPATVRADALAALNGLEQAEGVTLDLLDRMIPLMRPPLDESWDEVDRGVRMHRVADDENPAPTEYAVALPPEYRPLRSYPAVVALHDGRGPRSAVDWLGPEAARRGYIVIAPEYNTPNRGKGYHYSAEEHAAAQLSLRDARKRYAIDSNRVYLAGQLAGADMAWDFGLAHPDLFAGVAALSGFPAKYAFKYKAQIDKLPLFVVLGDLAPAAHEVVFDKYARPLIEDVKDVTYVDYLKRGLEPLPEEIPTVFDWMASRRRDPTPRSFDVATARESDARFYGLVAQELAPGRITNPEAADILGGNIHPATIRMRTSTQGNLLTFTIAGVNRYDVWVSPKLIDFKRKVEIRNGNTVLFKGQAKPDAAILLEDLRSRGDRQQLYHWKLAVGAPRPRGR